MTVEESKGKIKLRGQENYLEWAKRFQVLATIKNWGTFKDGKFTSSVSNEKIAEAFEWLVTNICDEAIGALNAEKTLVS